MACPPGKILNPRTLRCVSAAGKIAHELVARGDIPDYYARPHSRKTVKATKHCRDGYARHPITGRCRKTAQKSNRKPPSTWQLYIAQDNRSGPDFASVLFIDTVKARQDPAGSIRVDLGFIPVKLEGTSCSAQTIVNLIARLASENRLLVPDAGAWKPIAGFPYAKHHWTSSSSVDKLCHDLSHAV